MSEVEGRRIPDHDRATAFDELDRLLEGRWERDGDTLEYVSAGDNRLLAVADDSGITVYHRTVGDHEFAAATFTGPDAAPQAAAYAVSISG